MALVVLALCWTAACPADTVTPRLVIVASAKSTLTTLTPTEIRRVYLGIPLIQDGHEVIPLRNAADPLIQEMFLQHVLFMSAQAYERQMAGRVYRAGGNRIPEYANLSQIVEALTNEPRSITYMSHETATGLADIKIIAAP